MTTIGDLVGERIELNPDVPFPPFPLWLCIPSDWTQLDSHPGTWRRSADELINSTFRGARLPPKERRAVVALLEGLVADCQRAGAAVSLITVGRHPDGGAASFGLHVAFGSDGRPASLGRVQDMLPRNGVRTEVQTHSGPAILHRDHVTMVVPGTAEIATLTSLQIFLPLPGTTWTVVLSTASAHPELTDALEELIRGVAGSIRAERSPAADREPDSGAEFVQASLPSGPGYERGFGTLVLRRMDRPDGAAGADASRLP